MIGTPKRLIRTVSCFLIIAIICGILPWRELRADADTHGGYESYPFSISYEQNSTWNNSTQGQFTITNTSDYSVYSWTLEIDYFEDVIISSIWDASDITDYDIDENIKVSGAVSIPAGGTYTFGLIADGTETAPVSPISVNVIQYESDEPQEAPTNEPTPEITDEPIPTEAPVVTEVPDQDEEAEPTVFPYAIFSGSTEDDFSFQGWKSEITGDIYSGRDFLYQGSELYMEGYARTVGTVQPAGWITDMTGVEEGIDPLPMPDWSEAIEAKEDLMPAIAPDAFTSQNSIIVNGYYYVDDDLTINSSSFSGEGDVVIVASGNITYNVDTLAPDNEEDEQTGKILLYSEEGNVTINGTQIELNGIIYAPQGSVTINAYDTTINGRIVADRFSYSGSILNVTADPSDLELVYDLPDVTVTALQNQIYIGDIASFRIDIPVDNVYEIFYRLNGEDVQVEDPTNEDDPRYFSFVADAEGTYTFEAYVVLPYGEYVLDSASVNIATVPTPSLTSTPEPTATSTPTPTENPTPSVTDTPVPTEEPTVTPTVTDIPTPTVTSTPTSTPIPTVTVFPTEDPTPTPTEEPTPTETPIPTVEPTDIPTPTPDPEEEGYYTFSEGDVLVCGYGNPFVIENWNLSGDVWMDESRISLLNMESWTSASAVYGGTRSFSPDYSFSGRFTLSMDENDGGGGRFSISIAPNAASIDTNSISVYVGPSANQVAILENNDRFNPVASTTIGAFTDFGRYNEVWFDYDGQTHVFSVYVAPYTATGRPERPETPAITYEIDLSEKFEGYDEFTWGVTASNGMWYATTEVLHGLEIDPYPEMHQNIVTPTPTPTPQPISEGFTEISQGNTGYGYQVPFSEEDWTFLGESQYIDDNNLSILNADSNTHFGSSFLSISEDVGEDYEFYTRFSFTNDSNVLANGFAFIITPENEDVGFYGHNGYNMYQNSVIVEFDLDPQSGYYLLNDDGEFETYNESDSHVGIILNGNEEEHYAVADYWQMRAIGSRTDAWVDYNGETLSVYVCTINEFGHIYKYEEPLLSLDIDLEEYFDGNSILHMGFVGGDFNRNSDLALNGFEIAKDPFTTLLPDELPINEQDIHQVVSMGDSQYGYARPFVRNEWNGPTGNIYPNMISIASSSNDFNTYYYTNPSELQDDYSFSGRFTACIDGSDPCHYMNFVLSASPTDRTRSVSIHLDTWQSGSANWRNEFGEPIEGEPGGWYSGTEPFQAMVSICINGDERHDYAIAEYMPLRDNGAVHDIWFNYDGTEKKIYVYIATYDENGNVTKPDTPLLVCPLDLEEIFDGSHTVYPAFYGQTSLFDWGDYITYGFEFDPWPEIHNDFDGVLQIIAPLDDRVYMIGESIDISGRIGDEADPDTGCSVNIIDSTGNTIYENDGTVDEDFGYIDRIDTTDMEPGEYTIVLTVVDEEGNDYVREIPITLVREIIISAELTGVQGVETGLSVTGSIDCNEGSSYELQVFDAETETWGTFADGTGNKTDEVLGVLSTEELETGVYNIRLVVTSASGSTYETTIEIEYTAPEREFTDDELLADIDDDLDGEEITFFTDITGTVSGSELQSYTFELFPVDSEESVYSSEGTEPIEDDTIYTIDATLLMNGYYRAVLTAYAEDGYIEDSVVVLVTGNAKVGNFTISFMDITLPVVGLPVEVYRTYDSRQRMELGDFGYGWTMSVGGPNASISGNLGEGWYQDTNDTIIAGNRYSWAEEYPHEIYIDWGNGSSEVFEVNLSPEYRDYTPIETDITASFVNTSGGSDTLEIIDPEELMFDPENNKLYTIDSDEFAPQDFLLTRYDGIKFYFNIDTGLYRIEDTYGRTIDITEDGIEYSDGGIITFNRNEDGLITSITDGLGNEVIYSYDEDNNLVSVTDIGGYDTEFNYDEDHYLTDITADNGITIARNEYDDDGRLVATIDADGRRIEFDHHLNDSDEHYEVTTDRRGYCTIYYYDDLGNVTRVIDALNRTTYYTYDSNNNKTSETRPDGTTFSYSYDNNGNLLTATDSNGRGISSSYGSNGELLTMSAMGVTELTMAYDSHGNLISATDSSGNTQDYGYDSTGNLTSVTDSLGTLMNMSYDSNGNVTSITNALGEVTNFSYDSEGRLISRTITYQGTTLTDTYTYDAANRVTGITYANGNTVSYSYNQAGDVTSSTDSQGRTVNYSYDVYGNLTFISYPDGTSESFSYDAEGNNTSATDRMGRTVTFTYDAVGNCTSKTYDSGLSESYSYDSCDRVISSTNVYGSTTTYGYDYLGRNTSVTDGLGNTTSYTYNDRGNVSSVTDANGNTYSFTYDNNGNQTSVTYPNGSTYCSTYDARGRMTSQSDAYGNTTTYSYDSMDRLVGVTDALGGTWSYGYDSLGNIVSVTDANGNTTTYGYDLNGQVTSVTNAAGNTATTTYDQYGRVISTTDFGGTETTYTYDSMDRVLTETIGDEVTSYSYSEDGKLLSVTDPTGTITYSYNSRGLLSGVTNTAGETISYEYNSADQLQKITIDGQDIVYGYDSLGRLVSVTDSEGTTTYTYDAVGNRASTTYPNGVVTTYEYNNINALTSLVTTDSNGTILASYEYTIGSNGERLSVEEFGRTVEYTYDELNRLTSETVIVGDNEYETTYSYDSNSNRISMTRDGETTTYDYNCLNQITRAGDIDYTWDNAGNLVSQSSIGTTIATYTYDSRNRMISATVNGLQGTVTETYTYDYLGNRTSKTTDGETTYFTTDLSSGYSQVLKVTTGTEAIYYTRGFELISRREGTTVSYYLMDGGLSVRGLADEEGVVTDTFVFDAFGNETARTGTSDNSYGFQGEEHDATGLYFLRARYMDPSTGTFTSMDTYAGNLADPVTLHKYLYANNNPVMYCDPSGHEFTLVEFDISAAIDGMLESSVMYILDWVINDPESEHHSIWKLFGHAAIGLVAGGFGGALSNSMEADSFFTTIITKITSSLKLSKAETMKLFAICLLTVIFLPIGVSLKVFAKNTDNEYIGDIIGGFGDLFLDTYYILLSKILGCPPSYIPALIDLYEIADKGE